MTSYRISQLAKRVGLPPTTLRFYEQAGLLPAQRSESGYRLYGEDAVERLGFITSGKRLGLPLEEIRELLPVWQGGLCSDMRQRLRPMLLARIAEAEVRMAELDAFTNRLRDAFAKVDGPPCPGHCDAGCGCMDHQHDPGPVPIEPIRRRPSSRDVPAPIVCTLNAADQTERLGQWRQVLSQSKGRESIQGGVRIQLPTDVVGAVAALATAEQQCCTFFDFTLYLSASGVCLEAQAPDDAAAWLTEIFGAAD